MHSVLFTRSKCIVDTPLGIAWNSQDKCWPRMSIETTDALAGVCELRLVKLPRICR